MKRKVAAFIVSVLASVGMFAMPAEAQGQFYWAGTRTDLVNACDVVWQMAHDSSGYISAWQRNVPGHTPICWLQIKVSYWDMNGVWHVWTSPWVGNPPGLAKFEFGYSPAIWWVDYNSNNGGAIVGWRQYGLGCNAAGC